MLKQHEQGSNLTVEVKSVLSKEEHERRIQNIIAEKAEMRKRMEEYQEELAKKQREEREHQKEMQ